MRNLCFDNIELVFYINLNIQWTVALTNRGTI